MWCELNRVYIVAEIGGIFTDFETAKRLIDDAKASGADAVKLQTYQAETIVSKQAMFDMENTGVVPQQEYFRKYELDEKLHRKVFAYARGCDMDIFSTPSHKTDIQLLEKFSPKVYKIGADDLTNLPFLKEVARLNKTIMLSTGMSTLEEVREAVNAILEEGNDDIIIMHVVSIYPTAPQFVNLEAIHTLQKEFPQFVIGYSDHTLGIDSCVFAAVMGAKVIEKHFTFDTNADGPDHMLSATKEELKEMVTRIRLFETMRGNGIKRPMGEEVKNRRNNRKSIICTHSKKPGDILLVSDLDIKRPGMGIPPEFLNTIIGKRVSRAVEADSVLNWGDLV